MAASVSKVTLGRGNSYVIARVVAIIGTAAYL